MSLTGSEPTYWVEQRFAAMGSTIHVVFGGGSPALADWAREEIERLEGLWSRFRPDSDVSRCNRSRGRATPVAVETLDLVRRAVWLWHNTAGWFDPTVLHALERNGYDDTFSRVRERSGSQAHRVLVAAPPGRDVIEFLLVRARTPRPAPGCSGIVVDEDRRTLLLREGVGLDLGGIGKGYAADLVVRGLLERGATAACVGIGGDVRCGGAGPDHEGWAIDVENPFHEGTTLFTRCLRDAAIVTSTRLFRRWFHDGTWRHHLIDPTTGAPADRDVAAVVVSDREAWRAESLAKAALVAGHDVGLALLDRFGVAGWMIDDHERVTESAAARPCREEQLT